MNRSAIDSFVARVSSAGIRCDAQQVGLFQKYHDLLLQWNQRTNLISRADETQIIERHFLESMSVLLAVELVPRASLLDVGSGGGFPGLVLGIVRRDLEIVLLDSKRMKVLFLKEAIAQLGLKNVSPLLGRCEKLADQTDYWERFDYGCARAVGRADVLIDNVKNLIKPGGLFIAWKGGEVESEVESIKKKYAENFTVRTIPMDSRFVKLELNRKFLVIQKN